MNAKASQLLADALELPEPDRAALAADQAGAARDAAHALKAGAGQLGAARLQQLASQVEQTASAGSLELLPPLLRALAEEYTLVAPLLGGESAPPPGPAPQAGPPGADLPRLLVVEDNPDNRLLLRVMLAPHFSISEFSDGDSALAALEDIAPDLAIFDISLPGMDGEELLARVRARPRWQALPIIAYTAHAMLGDREHFMQAGFNGYVAKPITDESMLLGTIRGLLPGLR